LLALSHRSTPTPRRRQRSARDSPNNEVVRAHPDGTALIVRAVPGRPPAAWPDWPAACWGSESPHPQWREGERGAAALLGWPAGPAPAGAAPSGGGAWSREAGGDPWAHLEEVRAALGLAERTG